jgi:hypothetical protein
MSDARGGKWPPKKSSPSSQKKSTDYSPWQQKVTWWLGVTNGLHRRMARGGHGLPKVSLGAVMPYPSTPCDSLFNLPPEKEAFGFPDHGKFRLFHLEPTFESSQAPSSLRPRRLSLEQVNDLSQSIHNFAKWYQICSPRFWPSLKIEQ